MKILSLDLEMNQPSGRIIQIGACVGDTQTGQILEELSVLVDPGEELTDFIVDLTGIYPRHIIEEGGTLIDAYQQLRALHAKHQCFMNPITWGGGDSYELKQQLVRDYPEWDANTHWCFGRRWIDVKTLWHTQQIANEGKMQGGLARCLTKVGLQFKGRKHNAKDDAINTFYMFQHMLRKFR